MKFQSESTTGDNITRARPGARWLAWRVALIVIFMISIFSLLPATPAHVEHSDDAGYSLLFDGSNDYVELHETNQMLHTDWETTKTVSLWVKPNSHGTCHLDPAICDYIFGGQPRFWGITIGERHSQDKIWVWNYDGNYDAIGVDYTPGEWVHVTLVHAGGELRAYRNGHQVGDIPSGPTADTGNDGESTLYIGGLITGDGALIFDGEIDEVRIWDYERSTTDVMQDMYHPLIGDETGLVAYYQMSDGPPSTVLSDNTTAGSWDGTLKEYMGVVPPGGPQWMTSTAFEETFPTPTNTPTATNTPTSTPVEPSPTPTVTGTPPSPTPSLTPTVTGTPPTLTPTVTGTAPTFTPTVTGTPPTPTPTGTRPTATPDPDPEDEAIFLPAIFNEPMNP